MTRTTEPPASSDLTNPMHHWARAPLRDRALRHLVIEHIMDAVRNGHLSPGARVHEVGLARALDVSLSPVREALFRLADQGLLEHRPRRGFYVRTLDEAETREIYTFRALLEGFAARLIAERQRAGAAAPRPGAPGRNRDAEAFALLAAQIDEGARAARRGDRRAVAAANARFHDLLVRTAGHSLLERSWALLAPAEWLLQTTWTWADVPIGPEEAADWIERHRRLLEVLRSGDPEAAEREATAHVREAGEGNLLRRFLSERARERPSPDPGTTGGGKGAEA